MTSYLFAGRKDIEFQNSSNTVAAHWQGFTDTESGITSYHWCVGETTQSDNRHTGNTECSILPWTNVGLHNSVSRNLSSDLQDGIRQFFLIDIAFTFVYIDKVVNFFTYGSSWS